MDTKKEARELRAMAKGHNGILIRLLHLVCGAILGADADEPAELGVATGGSESSLVDAGAGWTENEWVGFVVVNVTTGQSATVRRNTATTLTVTSTDGDWTCGAGDCYELNPVESGVKRTGLSGREVLEPTAKAEASGVATGGSASTLVSTGEGWKKNQWAGYAVRNLATGESAVVKSNTATTLTMTAESEDWSCEAGNAFELIPVE